MEPSHDQQRISYAIVEEVADVKGVDPVALEPIYQVIDPDAVDALFEPGFDGHIEFEYAGCTVVVDGESNVEVLPDRSPVREPGK